MPYKVLSLVQNYVFMADIGIIHSSENSDCLSLHHTPESALTPIILITRVPPYTLSRLMSHGSPEEP